MVAFPKLYYKTAVKMQITRQCVLKLVLERSKFVFKISKGRPKASQRVLKRLKSVWECLKSVWDAPSETPRAPKSVQATAIYRYLAFPCNFIVFFCNTNWGRFIGVKGCIWGVVEALGASLGRLGATWRCLEGVLGRLGASLGVFRASLGVFEASWARVVAFCKL